jgi:hypothetical protein
MKTIRKILVLVMLAIPVLLQAKTYYIDPSGNNSTGNGSSSSPWKTLSYACSRVTTAGDVIHVNPGTYKETSQSVLSPGVSIEGEGNTSVIHSDVTAPNTPTILLHSAAQGTRGDQSISYIRMEADLDAHSAIMVATRSYVSIHNCEFENFFSQGVVFIGQSRFVDGEPSVYAKGNEFHDNIMTNCADYLGSGKFGNGNPNLGIGGQQDMKIYNNTIVQKNRGANANGYPIKFVNEGYLKGVKIYNNTLTKPPYDGQTWDLAVELWHCRGGIEVYNNTITGSLDFGGNRSTTNDAGNYGYALKVYNNVIGQSSLRPAEENGLYLERGQTGGAYVYNNVFKNLYNAMQFTQGSNDVFEDVHIYNNVITGVGILGRSNIGDAIDWMKIKGSTGIKYSNISFVNNTIHAGTSGKPNSGLRFTFQGPVSNLTVKNNIIVGFASYGMYVANSNITTLSVENNNFYGNNSNTPFYTGSNVTGKTERNNKSLNPSFLSSSDFRLQPSSPVIGAGTANGLATDFEGKAWNNPPSMGAFEYGSKPAVATSSSQVPECQKCVIESSSPAVIQMNFNVELTGTAPEPSAFIIAVNSSLRTVSKVTVSGKKVLVHLNKPVEYGNKVTLSYAPGASPLKSTEGIPANAISSELVSNNIDPAKPSVSIYPNPAADFINVVLPEDEELKPKTIRVYDLAGKLHVEEGIEAEELRTRVQIDLTTGIYIVQVSQGKSTIFSQKLLISK